MLTHVSAIFVDFYSLFFSLFLPLFRWIENNDFLSAFYENFFVFIFIPLENINTATWSR